MTPHYTDPWLTVYLGDCREVMTQMEPESVHCVVTSPPYWGLRDYGQPGQLGLEPTPEEYVADMVAVFREVRRVLRSDGTVWLNLGDSYAAGGGFAPDAPSNLARANGEKSGAFHGERRETALERTTGGRTAPSGLKPKDLVGIPWRVAFALQADGWYLRSDIIWSKPNPMPESVTDRPTKSHEYLFLLSKSPRYYFDAEAVREPLISTDEQYLRAGKSVRENHAYGEVAGRPLGPSSFATVPSGRNLRSVWTIATQPYPGAHFATFPRALVEPCIKAGSSEKGVCPECGAPWVREVERTPDDRHAYKTIGAGPKADAFVHTVNPLRKVLRDDGTGGDLATTRRATTGWRPSCGHHPPGWSPGQTPDDFMPVPATILDPFAGSGTTGMVAQSLSRRAVLIDLNADYLTQVMDRNRDIPLGLETA